MRYILGKKDDWYKKFNLQCSVKTIKELYEMIVNMKYKRSNLKSIRHRKLTLDEIVKVIPLGPIKHE